MGEARNTREYGFEKFLLAQTLIPRQLIQCPSGKAGFNDSSVTYSSGQYAVLRTSGSANVSKTTGFAVLPGGRCFWDHSADKAHYKKVNDRDFYAGRFATDGTSASDNIEILLNEDPPYDLDLARDPFTSVLVGTPAAGGFGYPARLGGAHIIELTATSEAQKCDALSVDGFSKDANAIVEMAFRVLSDGAASAADFSLGIANGTHASDADSIAESVFIHLDENSTTIKAESDDGSTEVNATDTLTTYTEGGAVAQRVEVWFDMRDPADVQIYVNGSLVLPATVFNVNAATGPFFLLAHLEKTSSTDACKYAVDFLRARYAEQ
jgi:hypothetical protein